MDKVALTSPELEGILKPADMEAIEGLSSLYTQALPSLNALEAARISGDLGATGGSAETAMALKRLSELYSKIGEGLSSFLSTEERIHAYPFRVSEDRQAEASRIIATLRDRRTGKDEFVYYTQRAYELLFWLAFAQSAGTSSKQFFVRTPVSRPAPAYAMHRIPEIDNQVDKVVMCVLLRGALLPSMIVSKEIEVYSSSSLATPFALFRIRRREEEGGSISYLLDPERSYFDPADLDGRDLVFADPMNATGGSLVAVLRYLSALGVKPRRVICMNVISSLKGALTCVRAFENLEVYSLWMDPALNDLAYILPGLGDAGDRLNGTDSEDDQRDIIRLIADYGSSIVNLYRSQARMIERRVLHPRRSGLSG